MFMTSGQGMSDIDRWWWTSLWSSLPSMVLRSAECSSKLTYPFSPLSLHLPFPIQDRKKKKKELWRQVGRQRWSSLTCCYSENPARSLPNVTTSLALILCSTKAWRVMTQRIWSHSYRRLSLQRRVDGTLISLLLAELYPLCHSSSKCIQADHRSNDVNL